MRKLPPTNGITKDSSTVEFELPRLDSPNVYLIHQTILRVNCIIEKAAGGVPDVTSNVGPVNLTLHSMWQNVSMAINDKEVTKSSSNYHYKCYMMTKMTYNMDVKGSYLMCSNWSDDTTGSYGPVDTNAGLSERAQMFRQDRSVTKPFKSEGCVLMSRLYHDLVDAELPLPPQTKINFTLQKAPDSFILMVPPKQGNPPVVDNEKYKMKLLNVSLYVPVGVLSTPMYNAILSRWPSEPIVYHYRPTGITTSVIPRGTQEYISDSMFPVGF